VGIWRIEHILITKVNLHVDIFGQVCEVVSIHQKLQVYRITIFAFKSCSCLFLLGANSELTNFGNDSDGPKFGT
jgi:hypothetical protein